MPAAGKQFWKSEWDEALTAHVARGELAFSMIADEINAKFNIRKTRNAVIGRAKRLGLKTIDGAEKRKHKGRFSPAAAPVTRAKPPPPKPAVVIPLRTEDVAPCRLLDCGPRGCKYPIDDVSPFLFCDRHVLVHRRAGIQVVESYCPGHFRLTRRA